MRGIWAVTRQTFTQCLRMKVAAAFILLLGITLAAMPSLMKGDGTLAGKIRTLLNYGTALTALILSVVTIFLSVAVVASDVAERQVFLVATKPLPRWQYVLGRWLGVVVLDAVLLGCAGGAMYVFAQVLRTRPALNPDDRRAVETEVFTARRRVSPAPPEVTARVQERIARLKDEGRYADALEAYKLRAGRRRQGRADARQADPGRGGHRRPVGRPGRGVPVAVPRHPCGRSGTHRPRDRHGDQPRGQRIAHRGQPKAAGRLGLSGARPRAGHRRAGDPAGGELLPGPVQPRRRPAPHDRHARPRREVELVADPTIQVSFKVSPAVNPPDRMVAGLWQVQNPSTGFFYQEFRRDRAYQPHTLTLSARTVDSQGRTEITYVNMPFDVSGAGTSVTILNSDVAVLYRVGGFEPNYLKALMLILVQLMFLAAAGVLAGTFLSFSVACLVVFAALPLGMAMDFMTTATTISPIEAHPTMKQIGGAALAVVKVLLPDFSRTNPSEFLVGGMDVAWGALGRTAAWTVGLRAAVLLAAACLIFSRRELARVQV